MVRMQTCPQSDVFLLSAQVTMSVSAFHLKPLHCSSHFMSKLPMTVHLLIASLSSPPDSLACR